MPQPDEPLLRWFDYRHLPPHLQFTSKIFADVADTLIATVPRSAERSVALRKLLEGKDAAVRAVIESLTNTPPAPSSPPSSPPAP